MCCPSRTTHYQPLTTYNVLSTMQCVPCSIYHAISAIYHLSRSIYHPSYAIYPSPSCLLNCQLYAIISHVVSDSIYFRGPSIKSNQSWPLITHVFWRSILQGRLFALNRLSCIIHHAKSHRLSTTHGCDSSTTTWLSVMRNLCCQVKFTVVSVKLWMIAGKRSLFT